MKLTEWYEENDKKDYDLYVPPMDAQQALNMLCDYLLGEDYYIVDPVSVSQGNTIIVGDILYKYSKKYRKERKNWRKRKNGKC